MRKLQLGTSQEGQGQPASHGEQLTPTAGGENQGRVEGVRWSMEKPKAEAGALFSTQGQQLAVAAETAVWSQARNCPLHHPQALGPWTEHQGNQGSFHGRGWGQPASSSPQNWGVSYPIPPHPFLSLFTAFSIQMFLFYCSFL